MKCSQLISRVNCFQIKIRQSCHLKFEARSLYLLQPSLWQVLLFLVLFGLHVNVQRHPRAGQDGLHLG